MKRQIAILAGLLALGGVGPASAQAFYYGPGYYGARLFQPGMPPGEAMRIAQRAGFAPVGGPFRRGRMYVVPAIARGGERVRVVVDAYAGVIMNVRPVAMAYGAPYPYPGPAEGDYIQPPPKEIPNPGLPSYGGAGPGMDPAMPRGGQMSPPRSGEPYGVRPGADRTAPTHTPNQHLANTQSATPSQQQTIPTRTPMPRPRPGLAANSATTETPQTGATKEIANKPVQPPVTTTTTNQEVPEGPPMPNKGKEPLKLVPVAPLD